ncbi:aminoimidazole riboside kinase [Jeotgalibacillus proteolyticus]|uniref:Aminoimidazole riboside kinase n=1 Tax=Jeotgalibacillus proteolyticus TaxID=2082395 RepID=A0A2S5G9N4_9BACL|nr:aminoimidazole riboside kinase [Jeotgalibacillus proteolyticus]PPA69710.1 aminoimidazole riboside kinase [Jeotgalibacillus proteolyticus]
MKNGIISMGEALIDFIPLDETNSSYHKSPGGAPANVAVGAARLGVETYFAGKVGDDVLGHFLQETLAHYGVNTDHLKLTKDVRTGVVFVTLGAGGERSFDFYIDPSADRFYEERDLDEAIFEKSKVFHFGSISMISEPSKSATQKAVELAKKHGLLISYDPNLRLSLWRNPEEARRTIASMLDHVDVLKISEEELEFLTGTSDIQKGTEVLQQFPIPLILVTLGAEGSYVFTREGHVHVPARKVNAIDTTGAGDAFVSGLLAQLHSFEEGLETLTLDEAKRMVEVASVSGALAASTKGAMTALPTLEEVKRYLSEEV